MRKLLAVTSSAIVCFLITSAATAEVRTYSFVDEAPAYRFSCGECSGLPYYVRGKVEGAFKLDLDFDGGVGTLNSLVANLSEVEGNFGVDNWQSVEWYQDFLEPTNRYNGYRPPYTGVLTPAAFRPLGPGTLTEEHAAPYFGVPVSQIPTEIDYWLSDGVGFEPAPADSWILYFNGFVGSPDGLTASLGASFLIYFEGAEARFSYNIPIIDATPSIAAAGARLVPEPSSLILLCLATCLLSIRKRPRRT